MQQSLRLLFLTFLALLVVNPAFPQAFQWAKKAGGTGSDAGNGIYVDAAGNSYVIGSFTELARFGDFTLTTTPGIIIFSTDAIFMAKYNASGQEIWAKKISNANLDYGKDIAVDGAGNIYVTGGFSGTAAFGNIELVSTGNGDLFLAKYNPEGNLIWAKKGGSSIFTLGNSLALDAAGNCYVTGYFRGSNNFGNITLNVLGKDDIFIAKYDTNGNVLWARSAGGRLSSAVGFDIAVTPAGTSVITGFFYGPVTIGAFPLPGNDNQHTVIDTFVASLDANGNVLWAKQINCPQEDLPGGITIDRAGNSYLTGAFSGTATFGTSVLTSGGSYDVFLVKYDPAGNVLWSQKAGGAGYDAGQDIGLTADGTLYITGTFTNTAIFADTTLSSAGQADIFIAAYDAAGQEKLILQAGGTSEDRVNKIALDTADNVYLTGSFKDRTGFGAFGLTSNGEADIFVAKFGLPLREPVTLTTLAVADFDFCKNPVLPVRFTTTGTFNPDNIFVVQLSDANGSFGSPVSIGTGLTSPIRALIPADMAAGTGYRIRVTATSPAITANDNGTNLVITATGLGRNLPNIITPNGDNLNDTFKLPTSCLVLNLKIYNRWGKMVYEQENYQNTWNGNNLAIGVYYYHLTATSGLSWKGWLELIR